MNIIFTVNTYYPNRDGVQFVTAYLAEGLAKRGHSVELLTYAVAGAPQEETVNGVSVKRFNVRTEHMRHIGDKKGYLEYILSRQNDVDVIINVGTQSALTDWLLPVIKKLPVPAVLHIHSIWDFKIHKTDKSSAFALAAKLAGNIRWAYYFLRYSNAFKSYSKVLQLHSDDYSVRNFKKWYGIDSVILENAVEDSFFEPCPKGKYIVNVSNYMPMKNQRKLIEVFAKSGLPEPWKLVLIGSKENDYCRSLKKYAKERFGEPLLCCYLTLIDFVLITPFPGLVGVDRGVHGNVAGAVDPVDVLIVVSDTSAGSKTSDQFSPGGIGSVDGLGAALVDIPLGNSVMHSPSDVDLVLAGRGRR